MKNEESCELIIGRQRNDGVPSEQSTSKNSDYSATVDTFSCGETKIVGRENDVGDEHVSQFMDEAEDEVEYEEYDTA